MRGESTLREDDRGQSGVLGVALITALVVVGTVGIIALGTGVLADARGDAQIESAEQAMTKLDATAALVALGRADTQRATVSLQGVGEHIEVRADEGWMNVTIVNRESGAYESTVMNRSLGAIKYQNGDTSIAYQGGGVWKKVGEGSVMVSPPEFHYRGNTLTLPLISVANGGDGVPSGDLVLKSTGSRNQTFPDPSRGEDYLNPLSKENQVNVTVHSEYYDAWGRFFAQRTEGTVTYDHPNETVVVELVVPEELPPFTDPFVQTADEPVKTPGSASCDDDDDNPGEGGGAGGSDGDCTDMYSIKDYPSIDGLVDQEISDCETGSNCVNKGAEETSGLSGDEVYYYPNGLSDDITVDTTAGNVSIVVNGSITDISDISVEGEGTARVYVKGDVTSNGNLSVNMENGNSPEQFIMFVHSSGDLTLQGGNDYRGLLYAPRSDLTWKGGGTLDGYVVAGDLRVNGFPSHTISSPPDFDLDLGGPNIAYINYLYVSSIDLHVNGTGS